ncbi:uncharacterized protein DNG_00058 [Cephalotrichum gorgonifer]|uniref:NADP-dependent oxidoreductase domain-containing protein n=1 Tax=Cephalotrichum gorgonifer TaxID=2041049 RepID=A0AAE8MPA9_9PEZI|nr:uncharacterized protein DNG_00058 [Cephalotrichum gorgonifer]
MSPKAPVKFILGTHTVGDSSKDTVAPIDTPEQVRALLDAFHGRGYTEIDTARDYSPHAAGSSELRLGLAGAASQFTTNTKVHSGTPGDHEPAKIHLSINQSLEALQTSQVETMFLHVPDRQTDFAETLRAMNEAFQEGKFKKLGLSNYSAAEVKQIIDICEEKGYVRPSVYQGQYNAIVRGGEQELFPLLRKHNIAFQAYSPAAGGFFSATMASSTRWGGDSMVSNIYNQFYGSELVKKSIVTVRDATEKYGISGHEAALRWAAFHSILDGERPSLPAGQLTDEEFEIQHRGAEPTSESEGKGEETGKKQAKGGSVAKAEDEESDGGVDIDAVNARPLTRRCGRCRAHRTIDHFTRSLEAFGAVRSDFKCCNTCKRRRLGGAQTMTDEEFAVRNQGAGAVQDNEVVDGDMSLAVERFEVESDNSDME